MYIHFRTGFRVWNRVNEMAIELTHIYTKKRPDFSMVEILILNSAHILVFRFTIFQPNKNLVEQKDFICIKLII